MFVPQFTSEGNNMSCNDIPSLLDIQNTKVRIDHFAELIDGTPSGTSTNPITGVTHPTYEKAIKDLGFKPASFTFVTGGTLGVTDADKCIYNPAPAGDNNWYSWSGSLPHDVDPGTNPATSDPAAVGSGYTQRTDVLLRNELAGVDGAGLIGSMSYAQLRVYSGQQTSVNVWGISNAFDGAAGLFKVKTSDTTSADNGGTILVDASGRRWYRVFSGAVDVKWFGAKLDGVTDDTSSFQAAISATSSGGELTFTGTALISSALNFANNGVTFSGKNQYSSVIMQSNSSAIAINNTGIFNSFTRFSIAYSASTPLSGATALYSSGSNTHVSQVIVQNCYIGFHFTVGTGQMADNFQIFNYESIGVLFNNSNDLFISKFILNAGDTTKGRLGGIRLVDKAEAFIASDGDILLGVYSITTDASINAIAARPAYNNFSNVFFDSSSNGCSFNAIVETEFVGCWFSNGRSGIGIAGATLLACDSLNFTNSRFFNNGGHGCLVSSGAVHTTFIGCSFESNSVTAGDGVCNGLAIAPNTTDFSIQSCKAHNGLYSGKQGYGIAVLGGTSSGYSICNNLLTQNYTGSLLDGGANTVIKKISGNVGYTSESSGTGVITSGGTSVVITHGLSATPTAENISITPTSPTGSNPFYLDTTSITSTKFTVRTASAVSLNSYLAWSAKIFGG